MAHKKKSRKAASSAGAGNAKAGKPRHVGTPVLPPAASRAAGASKNTAVKNKPDKSVAIKGSTVKSATDKNLVGKNPMGKNPAGKDPRDLYWSHVLKSVTPYKNKGAAVHRKDASQKASASPSAQKTPAKMQLAQTQPAQTQAIKAPAAKTAPVSIKATKYSVTAPAQKDSVLSPAGFDAATAQRLRKGQLDIEGRIDLHGMSQAAALIALRGFVRAAAKADKRTVLIITGKGGLREGGGVLRRMLPQWLEDDDLRPYVLALSPAQPQHGGGGAFYLRLRKKKN